MIKAFFYNDNKWNVLCYKVNEKIVISTLTHIYQKCFISIGCKLEISYSILYNIRTTL